METVRFYYDPVSPYAWLATKAIARIEAAGVHLEMEPVLFAAILGAHGLKGPAEIPAKRELMVRDVLRLAAAGGLTFRGPPGHPFNPLLALRMCLAIGSLAGRRRFTFTLSEACWERGLDISNPAVLLQLAAECDLNGAALQGAARTSEIKAALRDATERAIEAGVFGVPTFGYAGELFWGSDRIDLLLRRIAGQRIDEQRLQDFLARPPLATREEGSAG
ncbi:2-hydroxychromene-2-carboxylate isomerase [Pseudoduganella lurida]|uniref:2-hydroxychromene-2-carboxylate isomerase n=1 Tax=Pseudoduganella lurida TaxID=1036180 RepID=A0A562RJX9_9BURK|nr:2-hydroxychromene-2-carboxylate isomerase [Pseudoduganella lurida]TWI69321.1 2-hydroxychromene-2-carboxylate isomerase [Pseudoduganella lurida]